MKTLLPVLALSGLAAVALNPDTSGPYVDSQGNVYERLPSVHDFADYDAFDARFGHEVFTTRDGHRFQLDRPMTDGEIAVNRAAQVIREATAARGGNSSRGSVRAVVTLNHPVDEEFRSNFSSRSAIINAVMADVSTADAALLSQFGIDLVPTSGNRWDSRDSADIVQLLDEAFNEHGYNGQDMMAAFSDDPTPSSAIGVAYVGLPRQLTKVYLGFEGEIMQHETGHTYTLLHCCDNNCIMQPFLDVGALGNFHNYVDCSGQNHQQVFNNQSNRY